MLLTSEWNAAEYFGELNGGPAEGHPIAAQALARIHRCGANLHIQSINNLLRKELVQGGDNQSITS